MEDYEEDPEIQEENAVIDPAIEVEKECMSDHHSMELKKALDSCSERVDNGSDENCTEELFDLLEHVKHCMSKKLFAKLK